MNDLDFLRMLAREVARGHFRQAIFFRVWVLLKAKKARDLGDEVRREVRP